MLVQRRRRWADIVQMLYKCFVFAGSQSLQCFICMLLFQSMQIFIPAELSVFQTKRQWGAVPADVHELYHIGADP